MNPYQALGIPFGSSDKDVRDAYLRLVREHPPEREPDRFHIIQRAYNQIQNDIDRLRHAVVGPDPSGQPMMLEQAVLDHLLHAEIRPFPEPDTFRAVLRRELNA